MPLDKMTVTERRSVLTLSLIIALRMLGLFMVLPVFALYAQQLKGATPLLIGLTIGIYGLTQAIFQIPFGALSDYVGRKQIIIIGLLFFMLGSILAALATNIWVMLIGRALQGTGAVGSVIMALMADLTRTEQRTKAMAMAGMTIGFSFMLALILGPMLAIKISISGIFWCGVFFCSIAIGVLIFFVPSITQPLSSNRSFFKQFVQTFIHPDLLKLNCGIFLLHAIFTASFVVLPIALQTQNHIESHQQWILYLPMLIFAFCLSMLCLLLAEKKQRVKFFFCGAIIFLGCAELLLWFFSKNLLLSATSLLLFFAAFSLLEALLPSLVSKIAPQQSRGTALGIYSFSQFFGIFVGGLLGGWLYGTFGLMQVNLFCAILASLWLAIAFKMKNPQYSNTAT